MAASFGLCVVCVCQSVRYLVTAKVESRLLSHCSILQMSCGLLLDLETHTHTK